jgi:hypothetical protein
MYGDEVSPLYGLQNRSDINGLPRRLDKGYRRHRGDGVR